MLKGVTKGNNPFKPNKTMASRRKPAPIDSVITPKGNDIIIPIIGPTGFGKSTIINDIVGNSVMEVGHGLQPCTRSIQHVVVPHPDTGDNRRIILVDTPGIVDDPTDDYPHVNEEQILGRVDRWLKRSYRQGMRVAGIVYLYDITQPRALSAFGQPSANTGMLKKLCGEDGFQRIILATTKWDDIKANSETESKREKQLRDTYWNGMGPTMIKINSGSSSAWEIVHRILGITAKVPEITPSFPQATESKSHLKIFRGLTVREAREKPDSSKVLDANEDDVVIAIIGPMGIGKSSIINSIAGRDVMTVRHDLRQQCTPSSIQYVTIPHPNDSSRRMILVDTPGFDRTYEDAEILRRIGNWLESSYGKEMKLSGIICLHDISKKCSSQPSYKNLTVFKQLCGHSALANVILATTRWGQITPEMGQDRERQLADGYWKEMILRGSAIMQVQSDESAREIIDRILDNIDFNLVQDELIEIQKLIPDTEAGAILRNNLVELLERQKEIVLQQAREREAMGGGAMYQRRLEDIRKRIGETIAGIAELKVPLGPRIKTLNWSRSRAKPRGRLTSKMAEESRHIMDVLNPNESDIVIPIMGPTGVGKSSFINRIMGRDVATVGHDLKSCTSAIQHVILAHPTDHGRRIILVDTPGFDDTYVSDAEILRRIALWLARSYSDGMNLAGIVYLHDICQSRMNGASSKNLEMFRKLCGNDALANVVLGTTKWSDVKQEAGERREEQLRSSFWKDMIEHGSVMSRVLDDSSSAWDIFGSILLNIQNRRVDFVLIQEEIVEKRKPIEETEAGATLLYTQQQYEAMQQRKKVRQMEEEEIR